MRTRYRYDAELDEVVRIWDGNGPEHQTCHLIMPDIRSFVTQDKVEITSRSKLRAYERERGVKQVGNDWPGPEKPAFWDEKVKYAR